MTSSARPTTPGEIREDVLVLAHNYVRREVQDYADVVGDSLELAQAAVESEKPYLVVAGVDFMAETAAILNPGKCVVHPEPLARCSMAARLSVAELERARARHPGVPVVAYVNSSAAVEAVSDICCTSANAVRVVESLDVPRVIFAPDRNLAAYVAAQTGVEVISVPAFGCCPTHQALSKSDLEDLICIHPKAEVMVHPETSPAVQALAHFVGSTSAMLRRVRETDATTVIVGTDISILYRMRRLAPDKVLVPASHLMACPDMRMVTLDLVRKAVQTREPVVRVDPAVANGAHRALERMLSVDRDGMRPTSPQRDLPSVGPLPAPLGTGARP
ncbi:MAG TPA: quinolinate synthase NadA [Methanoregulaceae archaeon]|nr:quinolinate synthase NadA [Methanoregulaceae archaeon]